MCNLMAAWNTMTLKHANQLRKVQVFSLWLCASVGVHNRDHPCVLGNPNRTCTTFLLSTPATHEALEANTVGV